MLGRGAPGEVDRGGPAGRGREAGRSAGHGGAGGGAVDVGGGAGAVGVDGGDAVVARGGGVEPHVGVGGVGARGVGDEVGPASRHRRRFDLVAGDGGAAGGRRGAPGEVDLGRPVGGRGQPGGRAGRGEGVVVRHRHNDAADRDPAVVAVRARRAVGQRDRIVCGVRVVARLHRHRLRQVPVCRREGQDARGQGHVRALVPGDRHRHIRRRQGIENHRVSVPGRVLLRHRQRRLRYRDARRRRDHDVEGVADRAAIAVARRHLHRDRPHVRGRRRAREHARGGGEAQPRGQRGIVGLGRRVGQRVAGVRVGERVGEKRIAERRARRRRLVRYGVRHRRRGVGGAAHRAVDPNQDGPTLHRIVQKVPREAPHRTEPVFKDIRNTPPGRSAALLGIGLCRNGNDTDRAGILQHQKIGRREGERCVRRCGEGEGSSPHGRQGSRTGQDGDLGARRRPAVECHRR